MTTKPLFAALALSIALAAPSYAQDVVKTKSDDEKTKIVTEDMTIKTKMADDDGKMKVKGKSTGGDKMKATTKPRKDMKKKDPKRDYKKPDGMEPKEGMNKDAGQ